MAAKAESLHSRKGTTLWTAAKLNIVQWQLLVAFRNIAYVTVVLVTFKFQHIVRSWYSVQVTFICTGLWKIYLRSNLPNLFKMPPSVHSNTAIGADSIGADSIGHSLQYFSRYWGESSFTSVLFGLASLNTILLIRFSLLRLHNYCLLAKNSYYKSCQSVFSERELKFVPGEPLRRGS